MLFKILAQDYSLHNIEDHLRISKSRACDFLNQFCSLVPVLLKDKIIRRTGVGLKAILNQHKRDFGINGLVGFIDCTHFKWGQCYLQDKRHYYNYKKYISLVLQAVVDSKLRFLYFTFPAPGSYNDKTVFYNSDICRDFLTGAVNVNYYLNGRKRTLPYLIGDGIYPTWAFIAKGISVPKSREEELYTKRIESWRKKVEYAFGIFKKRWKVFRSNTVVRKMDKISNMMKTCICLHNWIINSSTTAEETYITEALQEDEEEDEDPEPEQTDEENEFEVDQLELNRRNTSRARLLTDKTRFLALQEELIQCVNNME